jgi:hypothetical protein
MTQECWTGPKPAARASGLSLPRVKRLMQTRAIAVRRLPGGKPEVDLLGIKRLIRTSTRPATTVPAANVLA